MDSHFEYSADGSITPGESLNQFGHLDVTEADLTVAYRLLGSVPRTIYLFEGALYAKHERSSFVGPPSIAGYAFSRQNIPVGRIAIRLGYSWLIRVTEPYWKVLSPSKRSRTKHISIEARFSTITADISEDCFHLNHIDEALDHASKIAQASGIVLDENIHEQLGTVETYVDGYPSGSPLGHLWPRCPDALSQIPVQRSGRHGMAVTGLELERLRTANTATLERTAREQWSLRPGGELVWTDRVRRFSSQHPGRALVRTTHGEYHLASNNGQLFVQHEQITGMISHLGEPVPLEPGRSAVVGEELSLLDPLHEETSLGTVEAIILVDA